MGFGLILPIFTVGFLALAFLLQKYLVTNGEKNLVAIKLLSEETKWYFKTKEEEFKISYDKNEWENLVAKLSNTRYFNAINARKFEFGFNVDFAKELVDYWKKDFNWTKQVDHLNKFPHFKINIDDITLHFIRVNSYKMKNSDTKSKSVPLLLLSGWPGSFYEFYKAIDIINEKFNNEKRHFDIIVPSIPGYGYSTPLNKKFDEVDTARLFDALMRHLFGEKCKYFVHGEDWGAITATSMAKMYPSRVAGVHTTMATHSGMFDLKYLGTLVLTQLFPNYMLTEEELNSNISYSLANRFVYLIKESGYLHLQATKPDTVGLSLTDSPAGLMAYILEKYSTWSFNYDNEVLDHHDGSLNKFSRDDLLTIVTLYWMTNSITSSMRYYKCVMSKTSWEWFQYDLGAHTTPRKVPIAISIAPNELDHTPYVLLKQAYPNLVQYKILKSGGHFGLFQNSADVTTYLIDFIDKTKY